MQEKLILAWLSTEEKKKLTLFHTHFLIGHSVLYTE